MNWIYGKWWKWLSAIMLVYVVIGGFVVPLGPGITKISPSVFKPDTVYTFRITAYHAHFLSPEAGKVQLWFKNHYTYYKPLSVNVVSNSEIEATFALASTQQEKIVPSSFDVVINNNVDGTFALREALTLAKAKAIDSASVFTAETTEPVVENNKHRLFCFPYREILYETIRNTFFHVPMWFVMTMLVFTSFVASTLYLTKPFEKWDVLAHKAVVAALLFGTCGYLTGLVWAKYTWYIGVSWGDVIRKLLLEDIKMAAALVAIFFYVAYMIIREMIENDERRRNIAAVYNIFAFVVFILCVFVLPRLTDSMHPGNGGNPAFSKYDLDSTLRLFFYPAVIAWILFGFWILSILIRLSFIEQKQKV
ncbi:MAG: cytochrome c biogenesis protein CcsA [Chitinophagales bacterium]|nr:cytochrome c biogenesis protein CcsA [Chitinophagales bacterium]